MAETVVIIGTFDTKGLACAFLQEMLNSKGANTILIDASISGKSSDIKLLDKDIDSTTFFKAGGYSIELLRQGSRADGIQAAVKSAEKIILQLFEQKKIDGIIAVGGSAGTTIGTKAMRVLPYGFPKVMVSTMASGDTRPYIQMCDITMVYPVVDIIGLNFFLRTILSNAANALVGMIKNIPQLNDTNRQLIALTSFGVTTPCVTNVQKILEAQGFECIVFHATGTGGMTMERMIKDDYISAVCDITTTELADELVGGILTAGPTRLEAAIKKGLPQVLSVGALDMVNFGPKNTVPEKFRSRKIYSHNENVTLMRTTSAECEELGKIIAEKLNLTRIPIKLLFPLKGISEYDKESAVFEDVAARSLLLKSLEDNLDKNKVELIKLDYHINEPKFAQSLAHNLLTLISKNKNQESILSKKETSPTSFWYHSERDLKPESHENPGIINNLN